MRPRRRRQTRRASRHAGLAARSSSSQTAAARLACAPAPATSTSESLASAPPHPASRQAGGASGPCSSQAMV
eukprot:2192247-Rhodomonas_salina.2